MRLTALALILAATVSAGDAPPAADTIATVGGVPITRAMLENELLRREGSDLVMEWVQTNLDSLNWSELADDAPVMQVGGHILRKRDLALKLLTDKGAKVREELVDIAIANQAVAKAGIVVDDTLLAVEFRLMDRDFQRKLKQAGQGHVDFASFLRVKEKQTVDQFLAQPAVRMLAGIHELIRRQVRAEYGDDKLQAKLDAERARWDQRASVDLSVIFIPWQKAKDGTVDDAEHMRLQGVANLIYRQIANKETTFTTAWEAFGKAWDSTGPGGRVGWVDRDGNREDETQRRIPAKLVERAFALEGQMPALLPPIVHDDGVDIGLLHGKRPARPVELAEVRDRLIQDIVEHELEPRTKRLILELRKAATVEYASLPDVIRGR